MNSPESPFNDDARRYARDALARERDERRTKLWSIFTWASTTLVAIIGGTVAMSANQDFSFEWSHRLMLSCATAILSAYAAWWIKKNGDLEDAADDAIEEHDLVLRITLVQSPWPWWLGYNPAIFLLFVAGEVTIWVVK
jgi:heme A synthase